MVDDIGDLRVIDDSELGVATNAGWRVESGEERQSRLEAEEYGTLGETLKGVGEKALSGATIGLSDLALAEGVDGYRAARAARERQLGGVGTAAEVVGAIAPLLLSGGASAGATGGSLAARGASLAARTVGAPVRAAAALGRGAEAGTGALLRAAGVTGESIAGRGLATGARLAAGGAVEGALAGAGQALSEAALARGGNYDHLGEQLWAGAKTGAMFGALSGGALGVTGGVVAGTAARAVDGTGLLKNVLLSQREGAVSRALGARAGELRKLRRKGMQGSLDLPEMADELLAHKLDDGSALFRAGDSQSDLGAKIAQAREEVGAKLGEMRKAVADVDIDTRSVADRIRATVLEPLASSAVPGVAAKGRRVAREFSAVLDGEVSTIGQLQRLRQDVDSLIWPKKEGLQLAPEAAEQLQAARREVESALEDATEAALESSGHALTGDYAGAKRRFGALKDAEEIVSREADRASGRNRVSPFETLSAMGGMVGAAAGNPALAVAGLGYSAARNVWRDKGEIALAVMANRAAKSEAKLSTGVKQFFARGGDIRRGVIGEGAGEESRAKSRAERTLRPKKSEALPDAYRRRLKEVSSFDPRRLKDLDQAMGSAPRATTAAMATMVRARQHLLETAPTSLHSDDALQPHLVHPEPNRADLEKWSRRLEVIDDPVGTVTAALRDNTLMREHVEALREVYPQTYTDLRARIWTELSESKERLPYQQRIRLGVLFGLPTDKSLRPENIARSQAIYAQTPVDSLAAQQPSQSGGALTQISNAFSTQTQNIEGGNLEI